MEEFLNLTSTATPIKYKKFTSNAKTPTKGTPSSAGYDLYADIQEPIYISPGDTALIDTGIGFELPINMAGFLFPRSGLSSKRGLRLANCVGVADPDYRDSYKICLYNDSNKVQIIEPGDRIAQVVFMNFEITNLCETELLSETERGINGFGSTGIK